MVPQPTTLPHVPGSYNFIAKFCVEEFVYIPWGQTVVSVSNKWQMLNAYLSCIETIDE
jgi:hypothetical protein